LFTQTQLTCFLTLSETLNFTKTAEKLFLTQQAVSKNISKLEKQLGFPLFKRDSHSVSLTESGEKLLRFTKQYILAINQIKEDFQRENNSLRIGILEQPEFFPLTQVHCFRPEKFQYDIDIKCKNYTPSELMWYLSSGKLDMIVTLERFASPMTGDMQMLRLHETTIALLVSKNNPSYFPNACYRDFLTEPLIFGESSSEFFSNHETIKKDIAKFGLKPSSILMVPGTSAAVNLALSGKGVLLGTIMGNQFCKDKLVCFPIGIKEYIVCVWSDRNSKTYTGEFAYYLKEVYEKYWSEARDASVCN